LQHHQKPAQTVTSTSGTHRTASPLQPRELLIRPSHQPLPPQSLTISFPLSTNPAQDKAIRVKHNEISDLLRAWGPASHQTHLVPTFQYSKPNFFPSTTPPTSTTTLLVITTSSRHRSPSHHRTRNTRKHLLTNPVVAHYVLSQTRKHTDAQTQTRTRLFLPLIFGLVPSGS